MSDSTDQDLLESAWRMPEPSRIQLFRLRSLRERLSTSLWIWPASAIACAALLGFALPQIDLSAAARGFVSFGGKADSARELLSTIASSMLTITGVVFSITILVLQLASSQFSPRVLRTFLRDRTTQLSLSVFLGSFVYALVVLVQVRTGGERTSEFVPGVSVYLAFVSALGAVIMLVRYIHHMAHSIRPAVVMRRIAQETHAVIDSQLPRPASDHDEPAPVFSGDPDRCVDNDGRAGVLTAVDMDELLELAVQNRLLIVLVPQVGEFVPHGGAVARLWGSREVDESRLRECIVLEAERTPQQDPAFGLRQLTDVAERALSPGVNDPTTAVQALDHIHDLLRSLVKRELGPLSLRDEAGALRVVLERPDWPTFVRLALDEVRHYGGRSIQVAHRIRELVEDVLAVAPPDRRPALEEQLRLIRESIRRNFDDPSDCALAGVGTSGRRGPHAGGGTAHA